GARRCSTASPGWTWPCSRPSPRAARWCARSMPSAAAACRRRRLARPALQRQAFLQRLDPAFAAHDLLELGAADRDVALVAADLHLRPGLHRAALFVHAHGHRGLAAAVADGLDLVDLVRPRQQVLAALEQLAAE